MLRHRLAHLLRRCADRLDRRPAPAAVPPAAAHDRGESGSADYDRRLARETEIFAQQKNVHALPEIFHYWSNRYLLPMEREFGVEHPEDFLTTYLLQSARRTGSPRPRFASLGCGNCDAEVRIATELRRRGLEHFTIECLDINPDMLERGRALADAQGLAQVVVPVRADFNHWRADGHYDGIMANQSLHHVLALEQLFDAVQAGLHERAWFVLSDMIGRNGHQRWPEAARIVREFWAELPSSYRYNLQLQRQEDEFLDWDCSVEGFEGIRAQDILPLMLERFGFEVFLAFGNVIDPFIDRGFGHHFDPDSERDRALIDRIHARDEAELRAGTLTPTHLMAVAGKDRSVACRHREGLSPAQCVRDPAKA